MKRFLTILLACVLTVNFLTVALAQEADFDVWDLISTPRDVQYDYTYPTTLAIFTANVRLSIPGLVRGAVDEQLASVVGKLALMSHSPSTNVATQALLTSAIPTGDSGVREIRYLASLKSEVQRLYHTL